MKLSVLIKTYNEERKIARCLDAVCSAVQGLAGVEVIVADSLSTDATLSIAARYPVKIVQMIRTEDRGCGAGVQLGFQHAQGEFVYLLDGDMELQGDFLRQAMALMDSDGTLGGVAGVLRDNQINNRFDRHRLKNKPAAQPGEVQWLAGGGLYRRAAVLESGGYAGNRNLKAYEEAELGLRLRSRGWRLVRLPAVAVLHTGHADSTMALIRRQWRSGRQDAGGVLLKSAMGQPWLGRVLRMCLHPLAVLVYWSLMLAVAWLAPGGLPVLAGAGVLVFVALAAKKRSLPDAAFSVMLWHVAAAGLLRGMATSRLIPPQTLIASNVIVEHGPDTMLTRRCGEAGGT